MGVSSVCVEEGERRSEEELGARRRSVGRSVGRRSVGRSAAGAAPKVRTPHNDVGNRSQDNMAVRKIFSGQTSRYSLRRNPTYP